jgi:hypothetical protein
VAKEKKKYWLAAVFLLFILYVFAAARPIPTETILTARWFSSLESDFPVILKQETAEKEIIPFTLGDRFGYVDTDGHFVINRSVNGYVSQSEHYWAEYEPEPAVIEVRDPQNEIRLSIENGRGYPLFIDDRIFLVGKDQTSLTALDGDGKAIWTYDFAAPLTCIDAAAGLVLTGSLDGVLEVLNNEGKLIYFFEPSGSKFSVITGCAISGDGSRFGIISGIGDQRFLLFERFGESGSEEYQIIYHEFLEDGFRRPVYISFIDHDNRIVFEREGGIGIHTINSRASVKLALDGGIAAIDRRGTDGFFFVVTTLTAGQKQLTAIRLPGQIVMKAPFKSQNVFFDREGSRLYVGGGSTLSSFVLEKR